MGIVGTDKRVRIECIVVGKVEREKHTVEFVVSESGGGGRLISLLQARPAQLHLQVRRARRAHSPAGPDPAQDVPRSIPRSWC